MQRSGRLGRPPSPEPSPCRRPPPSASRGFPPGAPSRPRVPTTLGVWVRAWPSGQSNAGDASTVGFSGPGSGPAGQGNWRGQRGVAASGGGGGHAAAPLRDPWFGSNSAPTATKSRAGVAEEAIGQMPAPHDPRLTPEDDALVVLGHAELPRSCATSRPATRGSSV